MGVGGGELKKGKLEYSRRLLVLVETHLCSSLAVT